MTTDEDTWANIVSGTTRSSAAAATGALSIGGDPEALERLRKILPRIQMLRGGGDR